MARPKPADPWVERTVALAEPKARRLAEIAAAEGTTVSRLLRSWSDALIVLYDETGTTGVDPKLGDVGSPNRVRPVIHAHNSGNGAVTRVQVNT